MIIVKKATCDDEDKISRLLKTKYRFKSEDTAKATFKRECILQHYRMAEENGEIVGLISWRPQGTFDHGVVEVARIAVASNHPQSVMVKEMLFDAMIAEADMLYREHNSHLRKVFSMFHADNEHLKDFFATKGMQQEAILRNHFHIGVDEVVYSMFLAA